MLPHAFVLARLDTLGDHQRSALHIALPLNPTMSVWPTWTSRTPGPGTPPTCPSTMGRAAVNGARRKRRDTHPELSRSGDAVATARFGQPRGPPVYWAALAVAGGSASSLLEVRK